MKILRAYKTRLVLNKHQHAMFVQYAGAARFVFNWGLADRIQKYKDGVPVNYYEQKKRFNALKAEEIPWIKDIPYKIQAEAFKNLDLAYQNFFRRVKKGDDKAGFPKFKSRKNGLGSFTFRDCIHIKSSRIKLPVIGWLKLAEKNYLPTQGVKILKATVSHRGEYWLISLQVEQDVPDPKTPTGDPIGIDVGLKSLAVMSDGKTFDNPKTLYVYEKKLARLNRELSRRKLGGQNRDKTKKKISRLHYKIACIRSTTLHCASRYATAIAKPSVIVLEDLNVKGMMQNRHLSKALADASISELQRQVEYKAAWNGIEIVKADRWYPSSKTCSACGSKKAVLKLSERIYKCETCGAIIDRDYNAALNLASLVRCEPVNGGGLPGELECTNALL
jgi:putative transposase